jgi:hypothetical protein
MVKNVVISLNKPRAGNFSVKIFATTTYEKNGCVSMSEYGRRCSCFDMAAKMALAMIGPSYFTLLVIGAEGNPKRERGR